MFMPSQASVSKVISSSPYRLLRMANQFAQSRPEIATELRMIAAYGRPKQEKNSQGGGKTEARSTPASQRVANKPVFAAEVRTPRIFSSLFNAKPVFNEYRMPLGKLPA